VLGYVGFFCAPLMASIWQQRSLRTREGIQMAEVPTAPQAVAGGPVHQLVQDMLQAGAHPFPADMDATIRGICAYDPALINSLDSRYFPAWSRGQDLSAGRAMLQAIAAYVSTKQGSTRS